MGEASSETVSGERMVRMSVGEGECVAFMSSVSKLSVVVLRRFLISLFESHILKIFFPLELNGSLLISLF